MAAGDIAAVQVRLKPAADSEIAAIVERLSPIVRAAKAALILNDRPDLAAELDCDGVHIGQDDGTIETARRIVGQSRLLGVSCNASRHLAMEAAERGADYVAFGSFFASSTKDAPARPDPQILTVWQETTQIPSVAIGGVTAANCGALVSAGADMVAASAGVWNDPAGPEAAARAFKSAIAAALAADG